MKPNFIANIVGTSIFTGYIPFAPGTFASIIALPLVIFLHRNLGVYLILFFAIFIIGIISAEYLGRFWHKKDDQRITIDEFIGILISFILLPKLNWYIILIGFILFRAFDIFKPLGIRYTERVRGGLGVMLDDVLGGIYVNLVLRLILLIG